MAALIDPTNLDSVDELMQHLNLPFDPNRWMKLYQTNRNNVLAAYFNLIDSSAQYKGIGWKEETEKWKILREEEQEENQIEKFSQAKLRKLYKNWSDEYGESDLQFLQSFYQKVMETQNVTTPILEQQARNLCQLTLRINKGLRSGADVKKDMDARADIIKSCGFTPANSKNSTGFDSIGELMNYFGKRGFHPTYHIEPQDSVDFTMRDVQAYLRRLAANQSNFAEQVEETKAEYELYDKIEEDENLLKKKAEEPHQLEYEDQDELEGELSDWNFRDLEG